MASTGFRNAMDGSTRPWLTAFHMSLPWINHDVMKINEHHRLQGLLRGEFAPSSLRYIQLQGAARTAGTIGQLVRDQSITSANCMQSTIHQSLNYAQWQCRRIKQFRSRWIFKGWSTAGARKRMLPKTAPSILYDMTLTGSQQAQKVTFRLGFGFHDTAVANITLQKCRNWNSLQQRVLAIPSQFSYMMHSADRFNWLGICGSEFPLVNHCSILTIIFFPRFL